MLVNNVHPTRHVELYALTALVQLHPSRVMMIDVLDDAGSPAMVEYVSDPGLRCCCCLHPLGHKVRVRSDAALPCLWTLNTPAVPAHLMITA